MADRQCDSGDNSHSSSRRDRFRNSRLTKQATTTTQILKRE